jgi:hypothetical protein
MTVISASKFLEQNAPAAKAGGGSDTAAKIKQVQEEIKARTKEMTEYIQGLATGETQGSDQQKQETIEGMRAQLAVLHEQLAQLQRRQVEEAQQKHAAKHDKSAAGEALSQAQTARKIDGFIDIYI